MDAQQVEFDNKLIDECVAFLVERYEETLTLIENATEDEWKASYFQNGHGEKLGVISVIDDDGVYGAADVSDIKYIEHLSPHRVRPHIEGLQETLAGLKIGAHGSNVGMRKLARHLLKGYLKPYSDHLDYRIEWDHI